jgi:predicted nucleic acid-binding protein
MTAVVADASVVASLILGEPRAQEAAALLAGRELLVPPLLRYEVTNAVRHFVLRCPDKVAPAQEALALCWRLPFTWVTPDMGDVLAFALQTGFTCYDAAYAVVARRAGVPLVTFDEKLAGAVGGGAA